MQVEKMFRFAVPGRRGILLACAIVILYDRLQPSRVGTFPGSLNDKESTPVTDVDAEQSFVPPDLIPGNGSKNDSPVDNNLNPPAFQNPTCLNQFSFESLNLDTCADELQAHPLGATSQVAQSSQPADVRALQALAGRFLDDLTVWWSNVEAYGDAVRNEWSLKVKVTANCIRRTAIAVKKSLLLAHGLVVEMVKLGLEIALRLLEMAQSNGFEYIAFFIEFMFSLMFVLAVSRIVQSGFQFANKLFWSGAWYLFNVYAIEINFCYYENVAQG